MKFILDSSVAFKWVVLENHSDKAIRLRDDYQNAVHELITPDIFSFEIGHALTRAERQKRIKPPVGWALWLSVMADRPVLYPSLPLMTRAFAISSAENIGIYDCLYVALAEQESCELVTADDRLLKNLGAKFPFLLPLASFP